MLKGLNLASQGKLAPVSSEIDIKPTFKKIIYITLQVSVPGCKTYSNSIALASYTRTAILIFTCLAGLLCISAYLEGSWQFLNATYGFV